MVVSNVTKVLTEESDEGREAMKEISHIVTSIILLIDTTTCQLFVHVPIMAVCYLV